MELFLIKGQSRSLLIPALFGTRQPQQSTQLSCLSMQRPSFLSHSSLLALKNFDEGFFLPKTLWMSDETMLTRATLSSGL